MEPRLPATVLDAPVSAGQLRLVTLQVPAEVHEGFVTPGQYLAVRYGEQQALWALASAPGEPVQVLLKQTPAVAQWLGSAAPTLSVSVPQGPGFPPEALASGRPVVMIGTGSGLGPLRSVLRQAQQKQPAWLRRVALLHGVAHEADLLFEAEFDAWAELGARVAVTVSQPSTGWRGPVGRVQSLLQVMALKNPVVFVSGQPELIAEVKSTLGARGVPPHDIHLNF